MNNGKPWRPARIEDVAAMAGVSIATVSRALSMPGKLKPATLARVEAAVRQTSYTPNLAARNLRARRSMLVLVVVPDIANPFFSDVLRGIGGALNQSGFGLLIGDLGQDDGRRDDGCQHEGTACGKARHLIGIVAAGQVDGVLLLNGAVPDDGERRLTELGVPVVAICEAIPGADIPQVEAQNREAARAAVALLTRLGHRRLAYLAGPARNILDRERRGGFLDGLALAGLAPDEAMFWPGDFTFRAGDAAATAFLALDARPTGLFAANDEMAIGFLTRVRAAGVEVPGDISIIGFDGIDFADYVEPRLTTFRQPRRALGQAGADLLVRAIAGEQVPAGEAHVRMPIELLVRESTGAWRGDPVARKRRQRAGVEPA